MSIVNQLMAAVLAVLIGLVSGTVYLMSDSSKAMLLNQLESHGQDTATHLGLYLAPFMAAQDKAAIETTVNAIFDSGFYQQINVVDSNDQPLFTKTTPARINEQVPQWFINLVEITPPKMNREITHQWQKAGSIFVQSRAGYAYEQLWRGTKQTFIWFVVLSCISIFFISILMRYILSPLRNVEEQAIALSQQRYIEQSKIPGTRELRKVVEAMNIMVRRVRTMFDEQAKSIEEIRRTAYRDELTGLANQRATHTQLAERLDYRQDFGPGTLIHLHIDQLQQLNSQLGMEKANNFIRAAAEQLSQLGEQSEQPVIGRISGSDFILLSHITDPDHLQRELNKISSSLTDFYCQLSNNNQSVNSAIYIGSCPYRENRSASQLTANARIAAEQAKQQQISVNSVQDHDSNNQDSWHQHVADTINNEGIFLQSQPVRPMSDAGSVVHHELYARIYDQQNQPCMAGEFISVVKQLNLMVALDKTVISKVIKRLNDGSNDNYCINLSNDALKDKGFSDWFIQQLDSLKNPEQLHVEINESSVLNNIESINAFREQLKQMNIRFGVDNFGIHPAGFSYLYTVHPDYIKVDGSLIREIDNSPEDRFFVRSLITAAHSLDIHVYAEHVERESQLKYLQQLEIDATQGWIHGQPKALS
ncbi:bifunctional diguanylate cyclase/phosphodiesterase [Amphritea sp. HPY]|uniref:bifunctional diguanylate cyclase/phosphodiesterase n=1 Tax=Amphritea sp. HPY TaxID=3421652 RepID=UPI003D7C9C05